MTTETGSPRQKGQESLSSSSPKVTPGRGNRSNTTPASITGLGASPVSFKGFDSGIKSCLGKLPDFTTKLSQVEKDDGCTLETIAGAYVCEGGWWDIANDGRALFKGTYHGSDFDIVQEKDANDFQLTQGSMGFRLDMNKSSSAELHWTKLGAADVVWHRRAGVDNRAFSPLFAASAFASYARNGVSRDASTEDSILGSQQTDSSLSETQVPSSGAAPVSRASTCDDVSLPPQLACFRKYQKSQSALKSKTEDRVLQKSRSTQALHGTAEEVPVCPLPSPRLQLGHAPRISGQKVVGETLPLYSSRYCVAVSSSRPSGTPDMQALIIDDNGEIIDTVYHHSLTSFNGAVKLSLPHWAAPAAFNEGVMVDLLSLAPCVKLVLLVLADSASSECQRSGRFHVLDDAGGQDLAQFPISVSASHESSCGDARVLGMFERSPQLNGWRNPWSWVTFGDSLHVGRSGRHFLDLLEPEIGTLIRTTIPCAPEYQRLAWRMERGAVVDLPKYSTRWPVSLRMFWDMPAQAFSNGSADIQVSAVFIDNNGEVSGAVQAGCAEERGVQHNNRALSGTGFHADLASIPKEVSQVFLLGSIASFGVHSGLDWNLLLEPRCRVMSHDGAELASYRCESLSDGFKGLIIGRLMRAETDQDRWSFQAIGMSIESQTWAGSMVDLKRFLLRDASEALRGAARVRQPFEKAPDAPMPSAMPASLLKPRPDGCASGASTRTSTPLVSPRQQQPQGLALLGRLGSLSKFWGEQVRFPSMMSEARPDSVDGEGTTSQRDTPRIILSL